MFLYHIYMIKGGFTTNERNKQVKTIRTMKIIREILIEVAKVKKYTFHFKQLSGDEIQKYKHITFYESADLAARAEVSEMWLTHFSPSLVNAKEYMPKVRAIFENSHLGKDGKSVDLSFEED